MSDLKKYLKLFNNHDGYEEFTGSTEYIKPNVSRCEEEKHVHYGPTPRPTAITFVETAITVNIADEQVQIEAVIEPSDVKNKTIVWKSSNPKVATVDDNGLVTLKTTGTFNIMAKTIDGSDYALCNVKCVKTMPESIELNKNVLYMASGDTFQLEATVLPPEASQEVEWSSSNPSVVSVDSDGLVEAVAMSGNSVITARCVEKPSITATCSTEVNYEPATGVQISDSAITVSSGDTYQLVATVLPDDPYVIKKVTWTSSNPTAVSVDENGLITANEISGDSVITVTTLDGGFTATCNVHIEFVEVTGLTIDKNIMRMKSGDTKPLTAYVLPSNATMKGVTWETSDPTIATVDSNGAVTSLAYGTCEISATTEDGNFTAVCSVNVKEPITGYFTIRITDSYGNGKIVPNSFNNLEGSTDSGMTWTPLTSATNYGVGTELWLRNTRSETATGASVGSFSGSTFKGEIGGNILSLAYGDDFTAHTEDTTIEGTSTFARIFAYCDAKVDASGLVLGVMANGGYTYTAFFYSEKTDLGSCTAPPELPATDVTVGSYRYMFFGNTDLKTAPELPATTVRESGYEGMFKGCSVLAAAPVLPFTSVDTNGCAHMFEDCSGLTVAPELNATTVGVGGYQYMFKGCSNLSIAPKTVVNSGLKSCCAYMFSGCTSLNIPPKIIGSTTVGLSGCSSMFASAGLTEVPSLPATEIGESGYKGMFSRCTNLTELPDNFVLPATTLGSNCYESMFNRCENLTKAPKNMLPAEKVSPSGYCSMFDFCTNLTEVPDLPATTIARASYYYMFHFCTSLVNAPRIDFTKFDGGAIRGDNVCGRMFLGCSSLVNGAELLATGFTGTQAYQYMYSGCTSLQYIKCLASTNIDRNDNVKGWVIGVPTGGTFVKSSSATWPAYGNNSIPVGWTVINA